MELEKPLSILDPGKRENMEDNIFPWHGTAKASDRFFIVCDGMGGHAKGEVASMMACEGFAEYFSAHPQAEFSEQYFLDAFAAVQDSFNDYLHKNIESKGMGTTLVMAYFFTNAVAVVHCGDSRCYHLRGHELLWRTRDHKLVEEWVEKGYITAQAALHHPKSNIITRAIQGSVVSEPKPDIRFITDLKPGDYLLLCTDGVYESLEDGQLLEILSLEEPDDIKLDKIYHFCYKKSKDNFSAYLLKIKNII